MIRILMVQMISFPHFGKHLADYFPTNEPAFCLSVYKLVANFFEPQRSLKLSGGDLGDLRLQVFLCPWLRTRRHLVQV